MWRRTQRRMGKRMRSFFWRGMGKPVSEGEDDGKEGEGEGVAGLGFRGCQVGDSLFKLRGRDDDGLVLEYRYVLLPLARPGFGAIGVVSWTDEAMSPQKAWG